MFKRLTTAGVIWPDGILEHIDSVILATGYRPDVDYLAATGALDNAGWPIHCRGLSLTVPTLLRRGGFWPSALRAALPYPGRLLGFTSSPGIEP